MKMTLKEWENKTGVKFTHEHSGKMAGMISLSTSPLCNSFCQNRCKTSGSICEKCYSIRMQKRYKSLNNRLQQNYDILTKTVLEDVPIINALYLRFEAFGDIQNNVQVINYVNICNANPKTQFTLFTKNLSVLNAALMDVEKSKNLNVVLSSPFMNDAINTDNKHVNGVFTVYDKEHVNHYDIKVNCGSKRCIDCLNCYKKHKNMFYVNELVK